MLAVVRAVVEGSVAEGKAQAVSFGRVGDKFRIVVLFVPLERPNLQEHGGKVLHRPPANHDAGILPMPVGVCNVDVFVREVDAAREGGQPVDDHDFAVGAVVLRHVEHGAEAVEAQAFDAQLFHLLIVVGGYFEHGADVVVGEAHVHPFGDLLFQNFEYVSPKFALGDDKVFEKDKLFRLFQLLQKPLRVRFAAGEILRLVAVGGGEQALAAHVFGALGGEVALFAVLLHHGDALRIQAVDAVQIVHQFFQLAARRLPAAQGKVQDAPDERQKQDGHDPRDFVLRIDVRIDDVQHEHDVDNGEHHGQNRRQVEQIRRADDERGDERNLQQQ